MPLHAKLRFALYLGGSDFPIGDLFQELNINGARYTLLGELEKAGLASWFNRSQITQSSRGTISAAGDLVPEEFREEATNAQGIHHNYEATFDWTAGQLRIADRKASPVPPGTQDMLSFLYQLSQFSYRTEIITVTVADGTEVRNLRFEVGTAEEISTPMGRFPAVHLHEMHDPGAPGMEIWLGADYRMLPVRFQKIEPDGRVSEEWIIKEIRVSDEQPAK